MAQPSRIAELDSLRGIAALAVVLAHYTAPFYVYDGYLENEVLFRFPQGGMGVELFFIISGFVIFMTLDKTKRTSDFLVSRFSRLYPAYWTAVILTSVVICLASQLELAAPVSIKFSDVLVNLTMLQEFFNVPNVDASYWTLARELSFYGIMFFLWRQRLLKHIDIISLSWLSIAGIYDILQRLFELSIDTRITTFLFLAHPNISSYVSVFIIGIMLYSIYKEGQSSKRVGIIFISLFVYRIRHSWWALLLVILFIGLFYLILNNRASFLKQKVLLWLGSISYSLYLIHQEIGYTIISLLRRYEFNLNASILIAIALSLLIAGLINYFIENPAMQYIRRLYKSKKLSSS